MARRFGVAWCDAAAVSPPTNARAEVAGCLAVELGKSSNTAQLPRRASERELTPSSPNPARPGCRRPLGAQGGVLGCPARCTCWRGHCQADSQAAADGLFGRGTYERVVAIPHVVTPGASGTWPYRSRPKPSGWLRQISRVGPGITGASLPTREDDHSEPGHGLKAEPSHSGVTTTAARHQLCQPAPGQPARALQVTHTLRPELSGSLLLLGLRTRPRTRHQP
jgi:hypothetical protein